MHTTWNLLLTGVIFNADGASPDPSERPQSDLFEVKHLVDDEGEVLEQGVPTDHSQAGEELAEAAEADDLVEHEVLGDLTEFRKWESLEVRLLGAFQQDDADVALDHGAALQHVQALGRVTDVYAGADPCWRSEESRKYHEPEDEVVHDDEAEEYKDIFLLQDSRNVHVNPHNNL